MVITPDTSIQITGPPVINVPADMSRPNLEDELILVYPLRLSAPDISNCVDGNLNTPGFNKTSQYQLDPPLAWSFPQAFTWLPVSVDSVCQNSGSLRGVRGLGFYDFDKYSEQQGYHPGADFFGYPSNAARESSVYSIAGEGIVVGIGVVGIEGENETSAAIWGSAEINEGIGYSVIVRYGHLYVLYGHLIEVDSKIYVGIRVDESTRLGSLGTFPGSELHLHIEIRSFGDTVAEEALVAKTTGLGNLGRGNEYGILELRAPQAEFYYDIPQFFVTIPFSYEQDYDGGTAIAAVSPLGPQLQNEATIVWGANCHLRYRTDPAVRTILTPVYLPTTVTTPSVLRGFKNGYLDDSPSPYLTPEPNSHR
jgi:hypothetical protein